MPGFFVSNKKVDIELKNYFPERCVTDAIDSNLFTAKRNTLNKFMQDKTLFENDDAVIALDGCLLNKKDLFEKYGVSSVEQLVLHMYKQNGDEFFTDFRGGFTGAYYDKKEDKWLVYTSHTGENPLYYTVFDGGFAAGCQVNYIIDARKHLGAELTFDEGAAYQMLTYAYMAIDSTFAQEIKRLRGGTYLVCKGGKCEVKTYYTFAKHLDRFKDYSEDQIVDELDKAFKEAVRLEFDKDIEYGYKHIADMSGGLDSRMTAWVPQAMGYAPVQLLTYCKSDYLDEKIAKEIAQYWKDELIIKPLDDASFLYDIDEVTFLTGGLSLYSGISGGNRLLKSLDMQQYGIEHTGMIGDAVVGSFWDSFEEISKRRTMGRYSSKLKSRLPENVNNYITTFEDKEMYLHYTRAFQGATNTYQIRKNYTEASSPFMNVEVLQLCMDVSQRFRAGHRMYKHWILKYYPDAAKFRWERTGGKITESKLRSKIRRVLTKGPLKLLKMIGKADKVKTGMTPMEAWISGDKKLKEYLDNYEKTGYQYLPPNVSEQLINDMKWLYQTGNANEQTMVLTVLSAAKLYFN